MDEVVIKKSKSIPSRVDGLDLSLAIRHQYVQEGALIKSPLDSYLPQFPHLESGDRGTNLGSSSLAWSSGLNS